MCAPGVSNPLPYGIHADMHVHFGHADMHVQHDFRHAIRRSPKPSKSLCFRGGALVLVAPLGTLWQHFRIQCLAVCSSLQPNPQFFRQLFRTARSLLSSSTTLCIPTPAQWSVRSALNPPRAVRARRVGPSAVGMSCLNWRYAIWRSPKPPKSLYFLSGAIGPPALVPVDL